MVQEVSGKTISMWHVFRWGPEMDGFGSSIFIPAPNMLPIYAEAINGEPLIRKSVNRKRRWTASVRLGEMLGVLEKSTAWIVSVGQGMQLAVLANNTAWIVSAGIPRLVLSR